MGDVVNPSAVRRFEVNLGTRNDQVSLSRLRNLIVTGKVGAATRIREPHTEQWMLAGDLEELREDFAVAAASHSIKRDGREGDHISRARLVAYMALAGLVAGGVMMVLAPLCLLIGVFAKFVLSWAAFGAVLALGICNAVKIHNPRIINVTAAGFAGGGLLSWFLHKPGGDFTAVHLAIIGLCGAAALSYAIQLPKQRAVVLTAVATVLFPIAVFAIRHFTPGDIQLPTFLAFLVLPLLMFVPVLPFAAFGGVIGALINWSD